MTIITAFRHRITIQEPSLTPDDAGGQSEAWTAVADVWGEIRGLSGSERIYADAFEGEVSHKMTLKQPVEVSIRSRFVCEGVIYDIVGVYDPDGKGRVLVCECVSRSR